MRKTTVSFTLSADLVEAIKKAASSRNLSASALAEELIREGLRAKRQKELKKVAISPEALGKIEGIVAIGGDALEDSENIYD